MNDFLRIGFLFSSPEPKDHWWGYRIGRPPSSVCQSSTLFKHLLRNHWAYWNQISYGVSLRWGNEILFKRSLVTTPRWPPCSYMVKIFKKSSQEPKGRWPWNLVCSIRCSSTTKFVQMMNLGWPWPILRQGQIWSLMLLYGEKGKIIDSLETIVVYDLKQVTTDRNDKKFLLTSKLCPLGAVCPLPRDYIHVLNHEKNV